MSSVKNISTNASPVTSSRPAGGGARQVSSQYGAVSELFAQTGVRGEDEHRGFEDFGHGGQGRDSDRNQPTTLKLNGTSRTFAMLFEDAQQDYDSAGSSDGYWGEEYYAKRGKPAFPAYMERATSTYDLSNRAIRGETRNRGGSINIAM